MKNEKAATSVLIVSGSAQGAEFFNNNLQTSQFSPIISVTSAGEAKRLLVDIPIDIVIINTPLPDELGVQLAIEISSNSMIGILLIVKSDMYDQICYQVEEFGILTVPKPTSINTLMQSVRLLVATKSKLAAMQEKTSTLESKMNEIRILNRAKLILIENLKMSEAEAHRYIEKQAMDCCVKRKEIAENIIKTYENY